MSRAHFEKKQPPVFFFFFGSPLAKPSARLSDLRWIRTRWKGLEEDTSLVYEERKGSTASFRAEDIIHVCVVAKVTSAWLGVDRTMDECVLAGEGAAALAGNVVIGVGAVFEGVTGSEVVVGEATCTGGVQLPVTVVILLPSVNSDEKRGWVEGVVPGPGDAGHWSVGTVRVIPFESQCYDPDSRGPLFLLSLAPSILFPSALTPTHCLPHPTYHL